MRSFINYILHQILLELSNQEDELGRDVPRREEMIYMHRKFWLESLKGRDHLEDLGVDGRILLKRI
jgi:hypothetical protein